MNRHVFLTYSTTILLCFAASAQNLGRLTGSVFDAETGKPLEGTNVTVKGTNLGAATDRQRRYTNTHLSPGSCTVSVISAAEVRRLAGTGQIPRLFEAEPGVDLVQNDVNDFNINARGFNSSLNRRMLVLVDNREPSILSLGAQEWNTFSFPLESGLTQARNHVFITSVGRLQAKEVNRPWGRTTYASKRFFFQADYSGRRTADGHQIALSSGNATKQFSDDLNFQFSPKLALVVSPAMNHTFRATFNRAFQSLNYPELFLRLPVGVPINLAPIEAGIEDAVAQAQGLPPGSVNLPLNFGDTPVLARGNENLQVEKIMAYELGYKGILFVL